MTTTLLQLDAIATGYGDLRVVWDVSMSVEAGSVSALLGRNGAGKTTVLRAVAGLNPLHRGVVHLEGRDLDGVGAPARVGAGIAYVQEGKRVFRALSVEDNLVLSGHVRRRSRRQLRTEIDEKLDLFPVLRDRRQSVAGTLSGGQQQMLAIASALMSRPRVLLLDEPSAGLAPTIVAEVLAAVTSLKSSGLAIVLVEQAVDFALAVADRVVVLDLGRVVFAGGASDDGIRAAILTAYDGQPHAGGLR